MTSVFEVDKSAAGSTTPILDSGVLPPRHQGVRLSVLASGLVIGVFLMEMLAVLGGIWHENWPAIFVLLLALAIAVHELGHLLAGWVVGFHLTSIQVGPLLLESEYGVLRARVCFDMMALGYTGMLPDGVRKLRRRSLIYIVGGPAANFLIVILVVLASYLVPLPSTSGFATAAGQLGAICLLLGMVSLVPFASNDGALVEMLLWSPLAARRWISTLALGSQYGRGIRARDWKQTWVKAAIYLPDKSQSEFNASWMAYLVANDRKEASLAAKCLERCLELTPALTTRYRDLVAQEAAVFSGWFRMDSDLANKWLLQVKRRHSLSPIRETRIKVILHCARHDFDTAIAMCELGLALIHRLPMVPSTEALKDSWLDWRSEIRERRIELSAV